MSDLLRPGVAALLCLLSGAAGFTATKVGGQVGDASWIFFTFSVVMGVAWLIVMIDRWL